MRKARATRRGGAVTSDLLAGTQQVAPPNPRRVGVAYSELDVQEGMAGLAGILGESRSDSLVAEMASGVAEGAESEQDDMVRRGRWPLPIDLDVEQVRLLQEIRKASSQLTLDSLSDHSARNSLGGGAFFMTRSGSAGVLGDEEEEGGGEGRGGRRGRQQREDIPEEDGYAAGNSRAADFLEGLAEFQRRIGVGPRSNAGARGRVLSRDLSTGSYDEVEEEAEEDGTSGGAELGASALPPGLLEFQRRLRGRARFSIESDETEDDKI
ncbi:hypothetical protein ElyMa_006735800 [Elysia marginata]|uniref:Uncharacterized protein n=1 Tax=Elysia marginata TaxID=1093978 RepID=A0AAV4IXV3_9GAST|nr:hypothetical protein ElyMa_006735800 [Elysia marginata]